MWQDIIWWIVLILTIISVLILPGLIQMLIDEIKKEKDETNE